MIWSVRPSVIRYFPVSLQAPHSAAAAPALAPGAIAGIVIAVVATIGGLCVLVFFWYFGYKKRFYLSAISAENDAFIKEEDRTRIEL